MERERLCSSGSAVNPKRNVILPPPMKHSLASLLLAGTALLPSLLATPARAATTVLHNFIGGISDGATPEGSLTLSGTKLYGMTSSGGFGNGVIFSMNTDGTGFRLLNIFGQSDTGIQPYGSLTLSDTKLYGMTQEGGGSNRGEIFSTNTDGSGFRILHTFTAATTDGALPYASLTLSGTKLYGMTANGGSNDRGTVFGMNVDGSGFSLLRSFSGADGANPQGSLTLSGTKLFGMTTQGGTRGAAGTIFSMNTNGTGHTVLHSFGVDALDGYFAPGSLTLSGSKLYGMTTSGGSANSGTIFAMNLDGSGYTMLHSFAGGAGDGAYPSGSLTLVGTTLLGMTLRGGATNSGALFGIGTDGSGFQLLDSFAGAPADGANPRYGHLTLSDNKLTVYGMTRSGGSADQGVIFSRAIGSVPEPGTWITGIALCLSALLSRRRNARM